MCSKCHPDREGEGWRDLLARYRIKDIHNEDDGWRVESTSGKTYHLRSQTSIDRESGAMMFRMTCDCPAWKQCRHIDAVLDMRYAEELAAAQDGDVDGMEIMERTT